MSLGGRSADDSFSIFSGLTDILTDTGSPCIRHAKSMSSATTVKANNMGQTPFDLKSPVSMTASSAMGTLLFAFSEEGEEEDSESETQASDVLVDNANNLTTTDVLVGNNRTPAADMKDPNTKQAEALVSQANNPQINRETPLGSNKAVQPLVSPSKLTMDTFGVDDDMAANLPCSWDPVSNNPKGTVVAGGVVAAAGATVTPRRRSKRNKKGKEEYSAVGDLASPDPSTGAFPTTRPGNSRHHAGKGQADGTSEYQQAMYPLDWSYKSDDESTLSSAEDRYTRQFIFAQAEKSGEKTPLFSPRSERSKLSSISGNSTPGSAGSRNSDFSASRQLINDLVWLEKKIADVRTSAAGALTSSDSLAPTSPMAIENADSLSYTSKDAQLSPSSHGETTIDSNGIMQNIVCRDCFAPPGKLQIIIHSTKDGPSVHSVKPGSSLEGHIFPGDLIIAVDNVDTRTFKAEDVMNVMSSKSGFERKITVLHFEN